MAATLQGASSSLGAHVQVRSMRSMGVAEGDPVASQYGKGKKRAHGSPGYCPSRGFVSAVASLCNPWCRLVMKSLNLVPGKLQLRGVETMPRGSAEPVLVLYISLVFAQKESYSPGVALIISQCTRSTWQWVCSLGHQRISFLIQPVPEQELALVTFFFRSSM